MLTLPEKTDFAAVEMLLLSIPESLGLLAAGVALVAVAVSLRNVFERLAVTKMNCKDDEC